MGRTIVVASGKGGVGKTTVVAGLSRALASMNSTVCVVDGDIGLNNLDLLMNVENKVVYDLVDCMQGKCRIQQALIKDGFLDNLFTLPAGKNLPKSATYSFQQIVKKLSTVFDFVIVDSPAGIEDGFKRAASCCFEALIVVTPHISSVRDASKVITMLSSDVNNLSKMIIVNRIRGDLVASGQMMNHKNIEQLLGVPCVGIIPESDRYNVSSSLQFLDSSQQIVQGFKILAKNLINEQFEQLNYTQKYVGVLGYFRRKLKKI